MYSFRKALFNILIALAMFMQGCDSAKHEEAKNNGMISHLVFFNLKPGASHTDFKQALRTLNAIPHVHEMNIGAFKDLKDKRAFDEFEIAMEVICKNEVDYQAYQKHPIHLELKTNLGPYLDAPPRVYDYTLETLAR